MQLQREMFDSCQMIPTHLLGAPRRSRCCLVVLTAGLVMAVRRLRLRAELCPVRAHEALPPLATCVFGCLRTAWCDIALYQRSRGLKAAEI